MTNQILQFKEDKLLCLLKGLPPWACGIFAACCVERILPVYTHFSDHIEGINEKKLNDALDMLWDVVTDSSINKESINSYIDDIDKLLPDINDTNYSKSGSYIEDVVSVVHYSLNYIIDDNLMNIVWTARRLYDLLDRHCLDEYIGIITPQIENQILQQPLIQQELIRQNRDLIELSRQFNNFPKYELKQIFRNRAKIEAENFIDY